MQILLRDAHETGPYEPPTTQKDAGTAINAKDTAAAAAMDEDEPIEEPPVETLEQKIADCKKPGPSGDKTLCTPCGARYASTGEDGKPWVTTTRERLVKFSCGLGCQSKFESVGRLSAHEAVCKGAFSSHWTCWWCGCHEGATSAKAPGPDMGDQVRRKTFVLFKMPFLHI